MIFRLTLFVPLLAALVLLLAVPGVAFADRLMISLEGADASLSAETIANLQEADAAIVRLTGFEIPDTIKVVYVSRHQSFDSVVGGRFPDWGVAAAVGERNLIAVRSPRDFPLGRSLRETLRHELAHLQLDHMAGFRQLPRWMHEGVAQQFAHQWEFGDDALVARAVFTDETIPLRDIDGVNSFAGPRAQLAYTQSYLAMGHFIEAYGWDGLRIFCDTLRSGANWDDAFRGATGADYAAFESEYDAMLHARYSWVAFLGDTVLLWIGLVGVFVVAYIVKRRRSAARRAEWEEQEAIEDIFYGPIVHTTPDEPDATVAKPHQPEP